MADLGILNGGGEDAEVTREFGIEWKQGEIRVHEIGPFMNIVIIG